MLTMWFAHGCLRFVGWQLSVVEALTLMLLVRIGFIRFSFAGRRNRSCDAHLLLDPLQLPALSPHTGSLNLVHVDANLPDIWIGTRGLGLGGFRRALSLIGFQHVRCCTRLHPSHCTRRQYQAGNDDG
jgi:hypothetical protein